MTTGINTEELVIMTVQAEISPFPSKFGRDESYAWLEQRVGRIHLMQRLGIEQDFEAKVFGQGSNFFHLENWYSVHSLISNSLRAVGLYRRGQRNTLDLRVVNHDILLRKLHPSLDGFTILQLSDLHLDVSVEMVHALIECVRGLEYDICVLTGDYRFKTFGPYEASMEAMASMRIHLNDHVYGVLGNHDTIKMVQALEDMNVSMLLNESVLIERNGGQIYLAGIDDAHYYRVDNIEKAAESIPPDSVSILLSHTPETYKQAAHAEFGAMLCGHTHGGQICLPGGVPVIYDARCPRRLASGRWRYHNLIGYTSRGAGPSIVPVRLNCPPEVTLHRLHCA